MDLKGYFGQTCGTLEVNTLVGSWVSIKHLSSPTNMDAEMP